MKSFLHAIIFLMLTACSADKCKELDLVIKSHDDPNNKIITYCSSPNLIELTDANVSSFSTTDKIPRWFQPSDLDSTKRKYSFKIKKDIIKTDEYQVDMLIGINNDKDGYDYLCWLKSFDNNRNEKGHLDFACWDKAGYFHGGKIDRDATIHMILDGGKEDRIFKIDQTGKFNCITEVK